MPRHSVSSVPSRSGGTPIEFPNRASREPTRHLPVVVAETGLEVPTRWRVDQWSRREMTARGGGALGSRNSDCCRARPLKPLNIEACGIVIEIETKLLNDVLAIREIVAQQGRLSVDVFGLDTKSDLYSAGLTSLATVGIMLALEERFDIEFPESMLSRKTFNSVASISDAVSQLAT